MTIIAHHLRSTCDPLATHLQLSTSISWQPASPQIELGLHRMRINYADEAISRMCALHFLAPRGISHLTLSPGSYRYPLTPLSLSLSLLSVAKTLPNLHRISLLICKMHKLIANTHTALQNGILYIYIKYILEFGSGQTYKPQLDS